MQKLSQHISNTLLILVFLVLTSSVNAHETPTSQSQPFTENMGQWHQRVMFRADLPDGALYLERDGFTYAFYDGEPLKYMHATMPEEGALPEFIDAHAFKVHFDNCNPNPITEKILASEDYHNYFIGNDQSKWASGVRSYGKVKYNALYAGIDMAIYDQNNVLKYDFIVEAGADPDQISMRYDGVSSLKLRRGNLVIQTTVNTMQEQSPVAYQVVNGQRIGVPCKFKLDGEIVSFEFPKGYDESMELIIDPILIFGSFSGSSANNFGFTATYDGGGNLYGGGIVFTGGNYPTTTGAYQIPMNGGTIDMGITKFSPDGTSLIYSTHIGGLQSEAPHTMVVGANDELIIMGTTSSADYPTTAGCFDNTFNGGTAIAAIAGYGYGHPTGVDIVVTRLSADGTGLIGSTFVGGSENDGITFVDSLDFNYGDTWRGEVIVDANDNVMVATTTGSSDFPTANAPQPVFGGGERDGCVFRLNSNLTAMMWGTYIGGSDDDAAYGIQVDTNNDIYICGGTKSDNLPITAGVINPSYGGNVDGYVVHYNSAGGAIIAATYIGTANHDQTYFVQLDEDDDVFVVGQSAGGTYPVSTIYGSIYTNPNSGQFIHKMNNTFTASEWSTTFGTGNTTIDISISAFLVSKCDQIYVSGWGGNVNLNPVGNFMVPTGSTTNGLPTTNDAFQAATDGSDFYLIVFDVDAMSLNYATFFGGPSSLEHVDGGTSRFDKDGKVYQAVCAGCGGFSDFPTTSNAYATQNGSSCNLGVFKFDLGQLNSNLNGTPTVICLPDSVLFNNASIGANSYFWDFGDGDTSDLFEPYHEYDSAGVYDVMLVVWDSLRICIDPDTAYLTITAIPPNINISHPDTICPGDTIQLFASGADTYAWTPAIWLSDPNIQNPLTFPPNSMLYTLTSSNACYTVVDTFFIIIEAPAAQAMPDTFICLGESIVLEATGGISYLWSPAATLDDPTLQYPTATPTVNTTYYVEVTSPRGCISSDTVEVQVDFNPPIPILTNDTTICAGESILLHADGAQQYYWTPSNSLSSPFASDPTSSADSTVTYIVQFINGCGMAWDTVTVAVAQGNPVASPDQWICPGDTTVIWAAGGVQYIWGPDHNISDITSSSPSVWPSEDYTYMVLVGDTVGCFDTAFASVFMYDLPYIAAGPDVVIDWGSSTTLDPTGTGNIWWLNNDSMSCSQCPNPEVWPTETTSYIVSVTDANGCVNTDTMTVFVSGSLYVPNTFSPNGDGRNDIFYAYGEEIKDFEMWIFNRWGQLIFTSSSMDFGWDGTYKSDPSQIDTYVWKIRYRENSGREGEIYGHVNLVK